MDDAKPEPRIYASITSENWWMWALGIVIVGGFGLAMFGQAMEERGERRAAEALLNWRGRLAGDAFHDLYVRRYADDPDLHLIAP